MEFERSSETNAILRKLEEDASRVVIEKKAKRGSIASREVAERMEYRSSATKNDFGNQFVTGVVIEVLYVFVFVFVRCFVYIYIQRQVARVRWKQHFWAAKRMTYSELQKI